MVPKPKKGAPYCNRVTGLIWAAQEQAVETFSNNCMRSTDRKPYAQLRAVDEEICCCCFHGVNGWVPGWCGDTQKVQEIAAELQARKVGRGNIAQIRNQENTMVKAIEAEAWLPWFSAGGRHQDVAI